MSSNQGRLNFLPALCCQAEFFFFMSITSGRSNAISASIVTSSLCQRPVFLFQIVANHAHEDHMRLSLAAEFQHAGHVSAWLDYRAIITRSVVKHRSKCCAFGVARHAVWVRFAQKLGNPLHFLCRPSIMRPQFFSMGDGYGDAP